MEGCPLETNNTNKDRNHLAKYRSFQKNTNFEIAVSLRDSVRIEYFYLNSWIESWFKSLVSLQTFTKINDSAIRIVKNTEHANSADSVETVSSLLKRRS